MPPSTDKPETVLGLFNFNILTERGIISGIYIGSLVFVLVASDNLIQISADSYVWVFLACSILGLIVSHVTYELLLTPSRWLTEPIVMRSFHKTVGSGVIFKKYADIRKFRELFIASNAPEYLKSRILLDERLRQVLTYLYTTSIICFLMLLCAQGLPGIVIYVVQIEQIVVGYVLLCTILAQIARSASFGRAIGFAYLYHAQSLKT